jgi:hypothetical protein
LDDGSLNLAKAEAGVLRLAVEALALVLCDDNNRTRLLHTAQNDERAPGGGLMLVVRYDCYICSVSVYVQSMFSLCSVYVQSMFSVKVSVN